MINNKEREKILNIIANNIKYYRKTQAISIEKLSILTGISTRHIGRIENKHITDIKLITLLNICNAFNISIESIIEE